MDLGQVGDRAYAMVGEAAFGDRMRAVAMLEEIGTQSDAFVMFGVCCGMAEAVRVVLENVHGRLLPAAFGSGSMPVQLVMPAGAERREPERAFAARFMTAWMNGDRDMCRALFFATFEAPGRYGHAANVVALLDMVGEMLRDADRAKRSKGGQ